MIVSLVFASLVSGAAPTAPTTTPTTTPTTPARTMCSSLAAKQAWLRLLPPGAKNTAAYFVLENSGDVPAVVVGVTTTLSARAELHTHLHEAGVMKMRKVDEVPVAAHGSTPFVPMGFHVMVFDVEKGPAAGAAVAVTLRCQDASTTTVTATASMEAPTSPAPTTPAPTK